MTWLGNWSYLEPTRHFYLEHSAFSSIHASPLHSSPLKTLHSRLSPPLYTLHLNSLYPYSLCTLLLYSTLFTYTSAPKTPPPLTRNLNLSDAAPQKLSYILQHLSSSARRKSTLHPYNLLYAHTPSKSTKTQSAFSSPNTTNQRAIVVQ